MSEPRPEIEITMVHVGDIEGQIRDLLANSIKALQAKVPEEFQKTAITIVTDIAIRECDAIRKLSASQEYQTPFPPSPN